MLRINKIQRTKNKEQRDANVVKFDNLLKILIILMTIMGLIMVQVE